MLRYRSPRAVLAAAAAVALLSSAALAQAAPKDEVEAGLQKLADASSYAYTTTTEGGMGGNSSGTVEKDGYTSMSISMRDNTVKAVRKGDQGVVQTDDGWQTAAELQNAQGPQRFMGMMLRNYRSPVEAAQQVVKEIPDFTKSGEDGTYSADLPESAAKTLLTQGGRGRRGGGGGGGGGGANGGGGGNGGPQVSGAKGSVKFTLADGAVSKMVLHLSGTVSFNGNDRDIDRTTTTEFKEVGTAKADVPADAKAKLQAPPAAPAAPAPQP